ncbi:hypothetical protein E2C01_089001 [Portunus trituberculatus]|uniref:Secreted protein n=1 Tax=Portunus trituberculatus TaxID=210409 RepID=A0A5B7JHY3_PORTR|nr:hypothetical protein [Portunus trituberculatus]
MMMVVVVVAVVVVVVMHVNGGGREQNAVLPDPTPLLLITPLPILAEGRVPCVACVGSRVWLVVYSEGDKSTVQAL